MANRESLRLVHLIPEIRVLTQIRGLVGVAIFQANKHPLDIKSVTLCLEMRIIIRFCWACLQVTAQKIVMGQREELQSELLMRSLNLTNRPFCLSSFPQWSSPCRTGLRVGWWQGERLYLISHCSSRVFSVLPH